MVLCKEFSSEIVNFSEYLINCSVYSAINGSQTVHKHKNASIETHGSFKGKESDTGSAI